MKAYRNNGASHTLKNGTVVPRDGIVETEENLVAAFPNKFEEVSGNRSLKAPPASKGKAAGPGNPKAPAKGKSAGKKEDGGMIDVTDKFTVPEGYTVKRDPRGCWVFDGDEEPANEKPLKRDEVEAFIKECAE